MAGTVAGAVAGAVAVGVAGAVAVGGEKELRNTPSTSSRSVIRSSRR